MEPKDFGNINNVQLVISRLDQNFVPDNFQQNIEKERF